jgi:hypothetical protein
LRDCSDDAAAGEAHKITRQRRLLLTDTHALGRFTLRMALVDLTGSVASWAKGLHDGLSQASRTEAAAVFALSPPFTATDPAIGDCDRLGEHAKPV